MPCLATGFPLAKVLLHSGCLFLRQLIEVEPHLYQTYSYPPQHLVMAESGRNRAAFGVVLKLKSPPFESASSPHVKCGR